ncbi:MAG: FAD-binding oxidoreductase [Pseudomonadota bacterium]
MHAAPTRTAYDVVIIGGAIMGSSTAWWLTKLGFDGSILVIEKDPTYAACSTAHTNSCIRQQFSTELNVRISQFGAEFITSLPEFIGADAPRLAIHNFGYLYLADTPEFAATLRHNQQRQAAWGAGTRLLSPDEIAQAYPFYALDDVLLGSINTQDEGYWDGAVVFDTLRAAARAGGVEYLHGEVTEMGRAGPRITGVTLQDGTRIAAGTVVNAAGPRAARVAQMAGVPGLPVEPRKRYTWVFKAEQPLDRALPLTIDPSGFHVREVGGGTYLAGGYPDHDPAVDPADFQIDHSFWQDHAWPAIATRIPAFEAVKVTAEWVGHYAYNTLDQNAILGPHPEVGNLLFQNGFSGHGLQQSPAMGRGVAEWICDGAYRSLDLTPFHYDRIVQSRPLLETAVI